MRMRLACQAATRAAVRLDRGLSGDRFGVSVLDFGQSIRHTLDHHVHVHASGATGRLHLGFKILKTMPYLWMAVDEEEDGGSAFAWLCRGERNRQGSPDYNRSQSSTVQSLSTHSEAGCLRRQAAAKLFFKVFDPGGYVALRSCFYLLRTGTFSANVTSTEIRSRRT
eukprot:COSAG05_NODE_891_length_6726_cov_7.356722_2_plen_167_part_00